MDRQVESTEEALAEICLFQVDTLLCGLDIGLVLEISMPAHVTPVYTAPDFVSGLANLRGHIVTIIDLRRKLHLPARAETAPRCFLIVSYRGEKIGLLVDEIEAIISASAGNFDASVNTIRGLQSHQYRGVYKLSDKLVALLDLDGILSKSQELATNSVAG